MNELNQESNEDFYKRVKNKLEKENEKVVEDLGSFKEDYPSLYEEMLDEIVDYAARLTRRSQLTIGIILSQIQIKLCLEDVTKSISFDYLTSSSNRFVLNVNVNYWFSLGGVGKNYLTKDAVITEKIVSFYLLHLQQSKNKIPFIFNLASELETTQYLSDDLLAELDPFSIKDINRLFKLSMSKDETALSYYNQMAPSIKKAIKLKAENQLGNQKMNEFIEKLMSSKHNDNLFNLKGDEASQHKLKNDMSTIIENTYNSVKNSNSINDKSWGNFSNKYISLLESLLPSEPVFDYKKIIKDFIKSKVNKKKSRSYSKPSRKVYNTILQGKKIKKSGINLLIAIDVSGSVREFELREFLNEIASLKVQTITILQFDHDLLSTKTYNIKELVSEIKKGFKLEGRGGTNFEIPMRHYEKNFISNKNPKGYSGMLIFTDGECSSVLPKKLDGSLYVTAMKHIRWIISSNGTERYLKDDYEDKVIKIIK